MVQIIVFVLRWYRDRVISPIPACRQSKAHHNAVIQRLIFNYQRTNDTGTLRHTHPVFWSGHPVRVLDNCFLFDFFYFEHVFKSPKLLGISPCFSRCGTVNYQTERVAVCSTVPISVCCGRRPQAANPSGLLPFSQAHHMPAIFLHLHHILFFPIHSLKQKPRALNKMTRG